MGLHKNIKGSRAQLLYYRDSIVDSTKKNIHLLGLSNPIEITLARRFPCIKSIDSAIPISYGYAELDLPLDFGDRGKLTGLQQHESFFNYSPPNKSQLLYIKSNIDFINKLCRENS